MKRLIELANSEVSFGDTRHAIASLGATWLAWEKVGLRDLMPPRLRRRLFCDNRIPVVLMAADEGVIFTIGDGEAQLLAWPDYSANALRSIMARNRVKPSEAALILDLPAQAFFRRNFEIPARAARQLRQVAELELTRKTPFRTADIHHSFAAQPSSHGKVTVKQVIVRREIVNAALARLDLLLSDFSGITSNCALVPVISLNGEKDERSGKQRAVAALAFGALLLGLIDLSLLWWVGNERSLQSQHEVARLRTEALAARKVADQAASIENSIRHLEGLRARPTTIELLRESSGRLPDGTWLTEWKLADGSLAMSGFSTNGTELVDLLEQSPLFEKVSLSAPITPDAIQGRERFSLIARVTGDGDR